MWPWEHLAVGYLLFSLTVRGLYGRPPGEVSAVLLAVATQLPDLIDKPLAWEFGLFPGGHAFAHSVFVAVPAGIAALLLARRRGRTAWGLAVLVGYWSHLAADVVDPLRAGDGIDVGRVLWPVVEGSPYGDDLGLGRGWVYIREFVVDLLTLDISALGAVFLLLPAFALALWVYDGAPGLSALGRLRRGE